MSINTMPCIIMHVLYISTATSIACGEMTDSLALQPDIGPCHDKDRQHGGYGEVVLKLAAQAVVRAAGVRPIGRRTGELVLKVLHGKTSKK